MTLYVQCPHKVKLILLSLYFRSLLAHSSFQLVNNLSWAPPKKQTTNNKQQKTKNEKKEEEEGKKERETDQRSDPSIQHPRRFQQLT